MSLKETLQSLSEDDLRKKIVVPLMWKLGCPYVHDNDGNNENGKDVLYKIKNIFRQEVYGAILLKINKIDKGSSGIDTVVRQVREAQSEFIDPCQPNAKRKITELVIMTSHDLTYSGREYISNQIGSTFPSIHFMNGDMLHQIISEIIQEHNATRSAHLHYIFNIETFNDFCRTTVPPLQKNSTQIKVTDSSEGSGIS